MVEEKERQQQMEPLNETEKLESRNITLNIENLNLKLKLAEDEKIELIKKIGEAHDMEYPAVSIDTMRSVFDVYPVF